MSQLLRWIPPIPSVLIAVVLTGANAHAADAPDPPAVGVAIEQGPPPSGTPPSGTETGGEHWKMRIDGFVELDAMHDSTQSFLEASANTPIMPRGTYAGDNGRTQFTGKNSRIGLTVEAPRYHSIETTGQLSFDLFGLQPTDATENDFSVIGTMRLRKAYLLLRTPIVDILVGQYPDLFGWGDAGFYPGTVAFLGAVGEVYHRDPQLRISKTVGHTFGVEIAAAAVRPAQRDAEVPDIEGGIRLFYQGWRGRAVQGNDRPGLVPLSLGISGLWRHFAVKEYLELPRAARKTTGWGVAINALLPIIPARNDDDFSNRLTLTAEFSIGTGVADRYSSLTGGSEFPALPNPKGLVIPPLFIPNVDSGLVTYDADERLRTIDWRGLVIGAQYYLPIPVVRVWVTGLYARVDSRNLKELTPLTNQGGIFTKAEYKDVSLFVGVTPSVQVGLSCQVTDQQRGNGTSPQNTRVHVATNLFF
ncbi:MAG: hypothetical protein QOI66_4047 [Myxococcales bacterium]|jgi:hypothetical protein|nr:hypothetical protein [Myxococcales bacterium]